jgi:hypothetical protein
LCGAASAYAAEPQKWCSDSYDKPAELIMPSDGPFVFKVGVRLRTYSMTIMSSRRIPLSTPPLNLHLRDLNIKRTP